MRLPQVDVRHLTCAILILTANLSIASVLHTPAVSNNATSTLDKRSCDKTCGYYGQLCCRWDQVCFTDIRTRVSCRPSPTPTPAGNGGHWRYWTRTWFETRTHVYTRTKVYSSYVPPSTYCTPTPTTTARQAKCDWRNEFSCGPICCKVWQQCVVPGQCGNINTPSGPVRPTSVSTGYITQTYVHTKTVPFIPASTAPSQPSVTVSTSTPAPHLSAGIIVAIVIGVLFFVLLLILLCLYFCFSAVFWALLGFFGIGRNRRRRRVEEVEVYHHHGSRSDNRRWHGSGRPSRPPPPPKKKKDGGGWGWGTIVAGLGALAIALRITRSRKRKDEKSSYSSSSYLSSGYSGSSSDRRTRDTRDTRRSSRR